ncbi:MAG: hypothetical protein D6785_02460, partial [Planctomycetota bacterium]
LEEAKLYKQLAEEMERIYKKYIFLLKKRVKSQEEKERKEEEKRASMIKSIEKRIQKLLGKARKALREGKKEEAERIHRIIEELREKQEKLMPLPFPEIPGEQMDILRKKVEWFLKMAHKAAERGEEEKAMKLRRIAEELEKRLAAREKHFYDQRLRNRDVEREKLKREIMELAQKSARALMEGRMEKYAKLQKEIRERGKRIRELSRSKRPERIEREWERRLSRLERRLERLEETMEKILKALHQKNKEEHENEEEEEKEE